jgi:hypothetical protein
MISVPTHPRTLLEELQARLLAATARTIAAESDTVQPQTDFYLSAVDSSPMPKTELRLLDGNRIPSQQFKACLSRYSAAPRKSCALV